jgi:hypothetical protein
MSVIVGAVFTVFTVRTKLSLEVRTPSLTVTVRVAVPEALAVGVTVSVRLAPLPPKTMFAFGTSAVFEDVALKTRALAAVWESPTVKATAPVLVLALIVRLVRSLRVGAVLGWVTVRTNVSLAESVPSLTETVIVAEPVWPVAGVTETVRLDPLPPNEMFPAGTNVRLDDVAETVRNPVEVSASPTVKAIAPVVVLPTIERLAMSPIVGAVFNAVTVRVKAVLAESEPSLTVAVIVAVPLWPAAGVTVKVREAPLPPRTRPDWGTSVEFEDDAVSTRLATGVESSPKVRLSAPVLPLAEMVRFDRLLTVGTAFAAGVVADDRRGKGGVAG